MAKKTAPKELIQQDFRNLKSSERLFTTPKIEELVFMQSIEGRAHNGAGSFHKRFYVNTTIDDIVSAIGRSPKMVKAKRQELIDEIVEFVDSALADDPRDRLVTRSGRPILGLPLFKERTVNYHDILRGLYLGGLRDDADIRKKTQGLFKINIGYGKCYLVDTKVMDEMGLDGEMLAHQENEDKLTAAKREIAEEINVKKLKMVCELTPIHYFYKWEKDIVKKTVYFFLFLELEEEEPMPQLEEGITEVKWFDLDEAIKIIGYVKTNKAVLEEVYGMVSGT